jgi:hypothetical protein
VADFGLSKEADMNVPLSGVKGTFGYVDNQGQEVHCSLDPTRAPVHF